MSESFDVVIIGAGPAGEIVGQRAVMAGLTAVVIVLVIAAGFFLGGLDRIFAETFARYVL